LEIELMLGVIAARAGIAHSAATAIGIIFHCLGPTHHSV
jgi:hypothetical protein